MTVPCRGFRSRAALVLALSATLLACSAPAAAGLTIYGDPLDELTSVHRSWPALLLVGGPAVVAPDRTAFSAAVHFAGDDVCQALDTYGRRNVALVVRLENDDGDIFWARENSPIRCPYL